MMTRFMRSFVTMGLLFCGLATHLIAAENLHWLTNMDQARETASAQDDLILLDFTGSDWCPPCKAVKQRIFSTDDFAQAVEGDYVLVEVDFPRSKPQSDAQREHNQELADQYEIMAFPTLIVVDQEGNEIDRIMGYPPEGLEGFLQFLQDARAKAAKGA
ncbi:MAG: trxA [Puniceicoccaceae bacterium 5H]|nr:MAG: trxA [Puniceicoccaceae bacterium 5H]